MYRKLLLCLAWLIGSGFYALNNQGPTIFLVGDSTVATFADRYAPMAGWGQEFQQFFNDDVRVDNRALAGKSSRSFIEEGKWDRVRRDIKTGDYVLIQFGHNDQKKDYRYTSPANTYPKFLTRYVQETRQKGGIPVLVTSVMRRRYTREGKLYDTHGDYPKAVRQLATELAVPLIDLHQRSFSHLDQLSQEATKQIFLWLPPKQEKNYPAGLEDNTHFSRYGAQEVGKLVVEGIKALDLDLKNQLKGCRRETRETITICAGDSVRIGSSYQKRAGTYRASGGAVSGCQTTRVVTLRVAATSASFRTLTVCQGDRVVLGGKTRTTAGTYRDTYPNRLGCDSVVTTRLVIRAPTSVRQSLSVCAGDSVRIGNRFRTAPGEYRHTQTANSGCSRTVITTLAVNPTQFSEQSLVISEGDSVWTGRQYRWQPGTYYDTLRSLTGCDSVVTTLLKVIPVVPAFTKNYQSVTLCGIDSLWVGGGYQRESGIYYDTLSQIQNWEKSVPPNGCCTPTIVITEVEMLPHHRTEQTVTLCHGERARFQGAWRTQSGVYYDTLLTSSGCDSLIVTSLTVLDSAPSPTVVIEGNRLRSSVPGDAYRWFFNGRALTNTTAVLTADSIGSYAVAVRIGSCTSSISEPYHYHPVITSVHNALEVKTSLRIFRSNVQPTITVEANLPVVTSAQLYVHDMLGNRVFAASESRSTSSNKAMLSAGGYQREVSFADQPSGVYVATLLADGKRHTVRFRW